MLQIYSLPYRVTPRNRQDWRNRRDALRMYDWLSECAFEEPVRWIRDNLRVTMEWQSTWEHGSFSVAILGNVSARERIWRFWKAQAALDHIHTHVMWR